jgi:hypothetical protein
VGALSFGGATSHMLPMQCVQCDMSVSASVSDFHYPGLVTTVSCCFSYLMPPSHAREIDGES